MPKRILHFDCSRDCLQRGANDARVPSRLLTKVNKNAAELLKRYPSLGERFEAQYPKFVRRYSDHDIQRLFDVFAINCPATDSHSDCALAIYSGRLARLIEISSQPGFDFDKVDEIGGCLSDLAHALGLPAYAVAIEEINRMRTLERPMHEAIVAPWSPDYVEYSWKQERYKLNEDYGFGHLNLLESSSDSCDLFDPDEYSGRQDAPADPADAPLATDGASHHPPIYEGSRAGKAKSDEMLPHLFEPFISSIPPSVQKLFDSACDPFYSRETKVLDLPSKTSLTIQTMGGGIRLNLHTNVV